MLLTINQKLNISNNITNNNKIATSNNKANEEQIKLHLPFSGNQGAKTIKSKKKQLKKCLPANVKTTISYERIKLLSQFLVKDKTKPEHKHNFF